MIPVLVLPPVGTLRSYVTPAIDVELLSSGADVNTLSRTELGQNG